jgi:hypothetical protein
MREVVSKHHKSLALLGAFSLAFGDSCFWDTYDVKLPPHFSVAEAEL